MRVPNSSALLLLLFVASAHSADVPSRVEEPVAVDSIEEAASGFVSSEALAASGLPHVDLFGGPGTVEGRFENESGAPAWNGWTSVDRTDDGNAPYWQVSTYDAENLGGHGVGNHAIWCGKSAEEVSGWGRPPGYGNNWRTAIEWRSGPLNDPSVGRSVSLDLFFNYDTEAAYDHVEFRYFRAGQWVTIESVTGTSRVGGVYEVPGTSFDDLVTLPIQYSGNDYGGPGNDEIILQIRFTSDGAGSNQDGLLFSGYGATQVDDITVQTTKGGAPLVSTEGFEGTAPYAWTEVPADIHGDFAKIFSHLTEPDPCGENLSPQATFIDDGTPANNAPGRSTGGSVSPEFDYGIPGGFVINQTGGISSTGLSMRNEIWSPIIELDAPGPADDGPGWRTYLEFEVFDHHTKVQPSFQYAVRTSSDGVSWSQWHGSNFVYFAPGPVRYLVNRVAIDDWVPNGAVFAQVSLEPTGAIPALGADRATPAPWFDDVRVYKEKTGTSISSSDAGILRDAFPTAAGLDVSTAVARGALDVPLDGSWLNQRNLPRVLLDPIVDTDVPQSVRMVWILELNPFFENALRSMPAGATQLAGTGNLGGERWTGSFTAQAAAPSQAWDFDLPDVDFVYPGDVLRYHYEVTSGLGVVSTRPLDLTGFDGGQGWSENFTMRALPTITDVSGTTPSMLVVEALSDPTEQEGVLITALAQNGLHPGIDFDYMRVRPYGDAITTSGVSADQLIAYETLLVDQGRFVGDELVVGAMPLLDAWYDAVGDRHAVWMGAHLLGDVAANAGASFLADRLGLESVGSVGGAELDGKRWPFLVPQSMSFLQTVSIDLQCSGLRFDRVRPLTGAVVGRAWSTDAAGTSVLADAAATVVHDRTLGDGRRRLDVAVPIEIRYLQSASSEEEAAADEHEYEKNLLRTVSGKSAAAEFLGEILALVGASGSGPTDTPHPSTARLGGLRANPNPFNPSTTVHFTLGVDGRASVRIYNVRGAMVRELYDGPLAAGSHAIHWDGKGDDGTEVASGVYLVDVRSNGARATRKLAMLK